MKDPKKAKWILGASGVMLSAVLLTQINTSIQAKTNHSNDLQITAQQEKDMTEKEKELVQLDWTNFEVQAANQISKKSDRKTKRT
ncbi:hypothetical protein ACE1MS_21595 [Lysinibacillus sp. fkY74-1]|uniref:Uncharacterized protein n=3 Tax=Lysinibacillus TaxID=400634 RepID=B1HMS3_LYSSC|nr:MULTISPECIES: hypothetical protein [Lysinibacillus]MBE5085634.1 hypothetical protein [Bacillus thuringiensis]ACA42001.1 hypothetical protein Bsph_4555 [Lysinibacillus sphaericus C3-41]AMO31731.1 hypothetical protein AR327_04120 [Lysinibacillus sphaericus]AMR89153.1 hypothetical protein A1T07_02550 [Lysinibacillus sphaericus]ANA47224.1 hypothetical protein A2J09_17760 [Lysinibacillus sphaericus]